MIDLTVLSGLSWKNWLYLALLAVLPFCGLVFGEGNQVEQFSIVGRILDEAFARGDFFLDSAAVPGQPRYYYALMISWLTRLAPLEIVIHALMLISAFFMALASCFAARHLLNASATGAAVAAMLILLNHGISIGHAGYLTFSNFQPASLAIVAAMSGVVALAVGRLAGATVLFLFAVIMHPTIGAEVAVLGYVSVFGATVLTGHWQRKQFKLWAVAVVIFVAGLGAFWVLPNLGVTEVRLSDAEFFSILIETRAPHHYLGLDFPKRRWLEAILFVVAILWIAGLAWRENVSPRGLKILIGLITSVVALCLASLYFVDIAENRLWATAQLFRMVLIVKWAGYLLMGWLAGRWLVSGKVFEFILVATMILSSADAISYAVVVALTTRWVIDQCKVDGKLAILATVPAVVLALYHHQQYGADDQALRLAVAGLALILLQARSYYSMGAVAAVVLVVGLVAATYIGTSKGMLANGSKFGTALTLADRDNDATSIARLARDIGPADALWLIPPRMEQFRFVAGKAVVADFTSVPFEDHGLREWHSRMVAMFGHTDKRGFGALNAMDRQHRLEPATDRAHDDYGADYAVLYLETAWDGVILAEAGSYKIVKLK